MYENSTRDVSVYGPWAENSGLNPSWRCPQGARCRAAEWLTWLVEGIIKSGPAQLRALPQ